ncbi:pilus assembly protein PilM [Candidatus Omnitrophota bacterium]
MKKLIPKPKPKKTKLNLKSLFSRKPVVGIEIGNDWLKILQNEPAKHAREISKVSFTKLSDIDEGVSPTILNIFKTHSFSKQHVLTYIPRHLVTVRVLDLPSSDPKEVNDMIDLQISRQTPYTREEIVYSHKILDPVKEGYTRIMLAIARRSIISARTGTLGIADIGIKKIAVSSECVYQWFSVAYGDQLKLHEGSTFVIVDIASSYTDFIVIKNSQFVFTRSISIGANQLLSDKDTWLSKFADEINSSVEFYQTRERGSKISKVFLSGAAKHLDQFDVALSRIIDIPVDITDPLKNINIKKKLDIFKDDTTNCVSISPLLGVVIKHGELTLDLIPKEMKIQHLMEIKRKQLTLMGALIASVVMMASLSLLAYVYNKNNYLSDIRAKSQQIEEESSEVEKMRLRIGLIKGRLDAKGASLNILKEIYKLLPKRIHLLDISIEEEVQTVIKGRAQAMSDVFKFVTTLEDSPFFENVKTTYTTTKKVQNIELAEFELVCAHEL